jgi:hypothetical protein
MKDSAPAFGGSAIRLEKHTLLFVAYIEALFESLFYEIIGTP